MRCALGCRARLVELSNSNRGCDFTDSSNRACEVARFKIRRGTLDREDSSKSLEEIIKPDCKPPHSREVALDRHLKFRVKFVKRFFRLFDQFEN